MAIDNNIISSLGAGSGINSSSLVSQLVEIEKTSKQDRIDTKRETYETQISDFGLLRSALATLQDAADLLMEDDSFSAKNATFTESTALLPSKLGDDAPVGDYTFEVLAIAQAQSLSTNATFSETSDTVGKGVLTFSFGQWDDALDPPETFTVDTDRDAFNITIDDTNNSLAGLRDAINAADEGVQASIINDGSGYRLVITAPSGASNELQVTVAEDGGTPSNTDANDLSRFAFGAGVAGANQQLIQNQTGADASLVVNGLTVSRSSNEIDDVLEGFEFTLAKAAPGEVIAVNIFEDKTTAEESVRGFIDAFNAFLEVIEPLTGYNEETEEDGSLSRDATTKSIISGIRDTIADAIPGISSGFTSLAAIGIRTDLDGNLSIDEDALTAAFADNFDLVKTLFAPVTSSSADKITVNSFGTQTVPGSYDVVVTNDPAKGNLVGVASAGTLLADINGAGATDYDFTITVNGKTSETISLTPGSYADEDALAAHIQSQVNNDATLIANAGKVDVIWNTDHFEITSRTYGSKSNVSVTAVGGSAADLGLDTGTSTAGSNVAGTIDGVVGFGLGNVLLPELNSDPYGLTLVVQPGATTSTINFSGGFGRELSTLLDQYLQSSGIIDTREDNIDDKLDTLDTDQDKLDRRISAYQARLQAQFLAMERIVSSLNSSGGFLDGIMDRLPFTAQT